MMKIAQVAPLVESVPPKLYGGTERVVSYLADELVALGHEVTLFASGDSVTNANLDPAWPRALRLDPLCRSPIPLHALLLERVARRAAEFDVIHFHLDWMHLPLFSRLGVPFLTTAHGRLDGAEAAPVLRQFDRAPVVSISDAQRAPVPHANWLGTVPHGLPSSLLRPCSAPKADYLAFLGRISPEKQPDVAIRMARAAGWPIRIAAKVDAVDRGYFDAVVRPLLGQPGVEFIGEIGEAQKAEFLGNSAALLFPIAWPEPFGMVMIEAMACGTPVVAFRHGSVPEVIDDGVTGFVVNDEATAAAAIGRVPSLSRTRVRQVFEERFTNRRMAESYVRLYAGLLEREDSRTMFPATAPPAELAQVDRANVVALRAASRTGYPGSAPWASDPGLFSMGQAMGVEVSESTPSARSADPRDSGLQRS